MSDRSIIEAVTKMTGAHKLNPVSYINATVNSVNLDARTCEVTAIDGSVDFTIYDVCLMAVVDDGLLIEPVVGSIVKIIYSQTVEPFVCQYSEIENITIISNNSITFNDGSYGGLVQAPALLTKINKLESDLNLLKAAFASWVIIPSDGGAALKATTAAWSGQIIIPTTILEIENASITHGI